MGAYLATGVALNFYVKKDYYSKEEILNRLKDNLNLDLYHVNDEDDKYLILEIKKDLFTNNIVELLKEECQFCQARVREDIEERIEEIKGKNYEEIIKVANENGIGFQYMDGNRFTNDVSYIGDDLRIFCDMIFFEMDGKIVMECYNEIFYNLRNHIIASMENVLKDSMVISIIG